MGFADRLILQRQRHLKWKALDPLEALLMTLCGALLFGFSLSVCCDIVTRLLGSPWLWLQEVTSTLFIYAIFLGAAVATRRNDHLYLTAFAEALQGSARVAAELTIRRHRALRRDCADLLRLSQFSARLWQLPSALEYADRLALCGDPGVGSADRSVHDRADHQWLAKRLRSSRT